MSLFIILDVYQLVKISLFEMCMNML